MIWILAGLLSAFFLALSSNIDQLVMRRFFKDEAYNFRIFVGFTRIVFIPLLLFVPSAFDHSFLTILILMGLGIASIYIILPYTKAVEIEESNKLAPFFQTIPIFMFLILYITLGETITILQAIASIIIIVSSICIMADYKTFKINIRALFLMLLTAIGLALSQSVQRYFLVTEVSWLDIFIWVSVGKSIYSFMIYCLFDKPRYFAINIIKNKKIVPLLAIAIHQFSTNSALIFLIVSLSLAPSGAMAQVLGGLQPLFVIGIGLVFAKLFPAYFNPPKTKHEFTWHIGFMLIMIIGVVILYRASA